MEEERRGRKPPLPIERMFAGSRLEAQILIRAYELAAPVLRRGTDAVPVLESSHRLVADSLHHQQLARGA
jgi:hypothetical protein